MSIKRNNCTFLWGILVGMIFPALVHSVPISIVEQHVFELDPLEESLPLQIIEDISNPEIASIELDVVPTTTGVLEEVSTVETSTIFLVPEALLKRLPQVIAAPAPTPEVQLPEAPLNNLDVLVEHSTNEIKNEEPSNEIENKQDVATLVLPVSEEAIITPSVFDHEKPEITLDVHHEEESSEKSSGYKKHLLFKIVAKIIKELIIEDSNLPVEEVKETSVLSTTLGTESTHAVEKLEEISFNENKLRLEQAIKALIPNLVQLETQTTESANVENVVPDQSSEEEHKPSSEENESIASASEESSELQNSQVSNTNSQVHHDVE